MVFEGKQLFFSRSLEIEAPSYSEMYELERAHDDVSTTAIYPQKLTAPPPILS